MSQKVHFIAIGGSVMHNLAIALHHQGYQITGSDDEIYDPARTRLQNQKTQRACYSKRMEWPKLIADIFSTTLTKYHIAYST